MHTQEKHLQQRIRMVMSAKPVPRSPSTTTEEMVADLQAELSTLNVSHSTLLAQLNTVSRELNELRQVNATLKDENEGWEFLVRERTLAGNVPGSLISDGPSEQDAFRKSSNRGRNGQQEALDEDMEMDELHSDLEAQSPIFDDEEMHVRNLDQESRTPKTESKNGHLAPPRPKQKPEGESLGDLPLTSSGLDLAAELGRAEVDLDGSQMRMLGKGDEGEGAFSMIARAKAMTDHHSHEGGDQKLERGK